MTTILKLKKHEDKRIKAGHVWIFSNEIDTQKTPLSNFQSGQTIIIENHEGKMLGLGYINPHTLLCARLLTRDVHESFDQSFLERRLQQALQLRQRFFAQPYYRLVYGESDNLPGLVIDRFNDTLVIQITTAGMEQVKQFIINAVEKILNPKNIFLRNDSSIRELEGLQKYTEIALGNPSDIIEVIENNMQFKTLLRAGQKTGWFYDHRDNRQRMQKYVKDKTVLDLFSYVGAWGIQAAVAGASAITCVDSSEKALAMVTTNAEINQVSNKVYAIKSDAFEQLKLFNQLGKKFDVVIADPPAFIKRRKDITSGFVAYQCLNELALRVISDNGILISASCSLHLSNDMLRDAILRASIKTNNAIKILEQGHQAIDHPVHPAIPETNYLKTLFCQVNKN